MKSASSARALCFSGFLSCMGAADWSNVPTQHLSKDGYDCKSQQLLTQTSTEVDAWT